MKPTKLFATLTGFSLVLLVAAASINKVQYGTFAGTFLGNGAGLTNTGAAAKSDLLWTNDGTSLKAVLSAPYYADYRVTTNDLLNSFRWRYGFSLPGGIGPEIRAIGGFIEGTTNLFTELDVNALGVVNNQTLSVVAVDNGKEEDSGQMTITVATSDSPQLKIQAGHGLDPIKLLDVAGVQTLFKLQTNGAITLAGTTNQVTFGVTNSPPASSTIRKWISVQVTGETNAYRIGLAE